MNGNAAALSQQPTANSQQVNNVLVSIIIPAYNTGEYIHRAIESSLRQTHKNVEVIVVDDGSKDNTLEVAESYAEKDSRVRVFHQENAGVSAARNLGIREVKGEYVMFLDSDDWLEDFAVESLLEAQINHPNEVIVFGIYSVMFNSKQKYRFYRINREKSIPSKSFEGLDEFIYACPMIPYLGSQAITFFKTDIIQKYNLLFREDMYYGEDLVFTFNYMYHVSGFFFVRKALVNILSRQGSAMHISYNDRKIFVNGKFNDYVQIMIDNYVQTIDNTNNADDLKALKWYHATRLRFELAEAFKSDGTELKKLHIIRENLRIYSREYITSSRTSLIKKLYFLCSAYLPIPLARFTMLAMRYVNDTIKAFKNRNKKEEILPYW